MQPETHQKIVTMVQLFNECVPVSNSWGTIESNEHTLTNGITAYNLVRISGNGQRQTIQTDKTPDEILAYIDGLGYGLLSVHIAK